MPNLILPMPGAARRCQKWPSQMPWRCGDAKKGHFWGI
jgi:hypothetical protein